MLTKKYPIGFWNYTPAGLLHAADVKDWADLGMTLAHSPEYAPGMDKEAMLEILDACAERGIKVIVCDHQRAGWGGASTDPEGYKAKFREALEDFGHHPAVMGFHIGDEPWSDDAFADCIAAHRIQLEMAPHLTPFLNFLPYWEGQEKDVLKAPTFAAWAEEFTAKSNLRILCYDCYSQMNPGHEGFHTYFQNLYKFSEAAHAAGTIPWTTLLSVGHFRYRCPKEDDLRWQLNTAVASGMKGILWFFIYMRNPAGNYRIAPIDEFGERTETFTWLSRVNRHFLHQFGDFFNTADHKITYHIGKAYGGYSLYNGQEETILSVTCDQELDGVIGFFEKEGETFIAVVNNSQTDSGLFKIHVPQGTKSLARLNWNGSWGELATHRHDAFYGETESECIGGDWLAPGQLKLYRYEK